ncbi:Putative nuclease, partial [Frankliniella fusca]
MELAHRDDRCRLLGYSAYAHIPWLLKPLVPSAPGTPESGYNKLHAQCRNPVERCLSVMKSRWRCLCPPLHYHPEKAGKIFNACAVLHYLLLEERVAVPVDYEVFTNPPEDDDIVDPMLPAHLRQEADANRAYLIDHAHWYENRHNHLLFV